MSSFLRHKIKIIEFNEFKINLQKQQFFYFSRNRNLNTPITLQQVRETYKNNFAPKLQYPELNQLLEVDTTRQIPKSIEDTDIYLGIESCLGRPVLFDTHMSQNRVLWSGWMVKI